MEEESKRTKHYHAVYIEQYRERTFKIRTKLSCVCKVSSEKNNLFLKPVQQSFISHFHFVFNSQASAMVNTYFATT